VNSVESCLKHAANFKSPFVLKADGLAAGKGVYICKDLGELEQAAKELFDNKKLGPAGERALLEKFQPGWELSYLILTNGEDYKPLPLAQDHKRLLDDDKGPNTGGMGVVAPLRIDLSLEESIQNEILIPIVEELKNQKFFYRGILYVGIMITDSGPTVLEINVRFGDPEAQALLPLLDGDWLNIFYELAKGNLIPMNWRPISSACVVLAAKGYPDQPQKNVVIEGDLHFETMSSYFLHPATKKREDGEWVTDGGRVLNAIGLGANLSEAIDKAYQQASKVSWPGIITRRDIGQKLIRP
jgi:phosphoribosylamine--glycine ligase